MDIIPHKQNLDEVFSKKIYYIDFYQRQYKWTEEPVKKMLDDIFFKFNLEYEEYKNPSKKISEIIDKYSWYYLNTYVTNKVDGKLYIVDGQQRLTTLTLIFIYLRHLGNDISWKNTHGKDRIIQHLSGNIVTHNLDSSSFIINHEREADILEKIYARKTDINPKTLTGENLHNNYNTIKAYIQKEINKDEEKFTAFTHYLFKRVVLIELNASQTDIPMLFEVINDRGVRLKPYEILKGKLLGQIQKSKVQKYDQLWDEKIKKLEGLSTRRIKGTDSFFEYYLKAKYVDNRKEGEGQKINRGNYHRRIFELDKIKNELELNNDEAVENFLDKEFSYYSDLYIKIWNFRNNYQDEFKHVYFNGLNEMDTQFLLILSICSTNDSEKETDEKIKKISYYVDRMYSLLSLLQSHDSNVFNDKIYEISKNIRDKNIEQIEIKSIFNNEISKVLLKKKNREIESIFKWSIFKTTGVDLNSVFKRYFFSRIEDFLAIGIGQKKRATFDKLMKYRRTENNYQIEHIIARNEENIKQFKDEEEFETERNRLGALLLLKGRDNCSSNNESYKKKLETYSGTLLWNETLRKDFYKSNKDFDDFRKENDLKFQPFNYKFAKKQVEARQALLFEMIKIIWK